MRQRCLAFLARGYGRLRVRIALRGQRRDGRGLRLERRRELGGRRVALGQARRQQRALIPQSGPRLVALGLERTQRLGNRVRFGPQLLAPPGVRLALRLERGGRVPQRVALGGDDLHRLVLGRQLGFHERRPFRLQRQLGLELTAIGAEHRQMRLCCLAFLARDYGRLRVRIALRGQRRDGRGLRLERRRELGGRRVALAQARRQQRALIPQSGPRLVALDLERTQRRDDRVRLGLQRGRRIPQPVALGGNGRHRLVLRRQLRLDARQRRGAIRDPRLEQRALVGEPAAQVLPIALEIPERLRRRLALHLPGRPCLAQGVAFRQRCVEGSVARRQLGLEASEGVVALGRDRAHPGLSLLQRSRRLSQLLLQPIALLAGRGELVEDLPRPLALIGQLAGERLVLGAGSDERFAVGDRLGPGLLEQREVFLRARRAARPPRSCGPTPRPPARRCTRRCRRAGAPAARTARWQR